MEKNFYIIGIMGSIIIMVLTIIFIDNPFNIVKGINFDYPLFLVYSIPICILFYLMLFGLFKMIKK